MWDKLLEFFGIPEKEIKSEAKPVKLYWEDDFVETRFKVFRPTAVSQVSIVYEKVCEYSKEVFYGKLVDDSHVHRHQNYTPFGHASTCPFSIDNPTRRYELVRDNVNKCIVNNRHHWRSEENLANRYLDDFQKTGRFKFININQEKCIYSADRARLSYKLIEICEIDNCVIFTKKEI